MNRRQFLLYASATTAITTVNLLLFPGTSEGVPMTAHKVGYPRIKIATLSELKDHLPIAFKYPGNELNTAAMIVKLGGVEAGGGIGKQKDIVAFSTICTHRGGSLQETYKSTDDQRTLGMCPLHLSLYDLRRYGIIASGQAYESLPQVLLEQEDDDIYATGMMGLIYGRNENS